jgi:glycerol dehydrogenase
VPVWTGLSNIYSNQGAFLYDVTFDRCPDFTDLDYKLIHKPHRKRTFNCGIGDAFSKVVRSIGKQW